MEISISITVPLFGLSLTAEIDGQYTHDTFAPESVYLGTISYTTERSQLDCGLGMFLPTPADMSDFYSTHAEAIDAAVAAELADHTEAAADSYESLRQEEIDDTAERLRA